MGISSEPLEVKVLEEQANKWIKIKTSRYDHSSYQTRVGAELGL